MICSNCHKKVNRINACRIIVSCGTVQIKKQIICQKCAKHLLLLHCAKLFGRTPTRTELDMSENLLEDMINQLLQADIVESEYF